MVIAPAIGAVALLALGVQGWLLLQLLQQSGRLLVRIEALEVSRAGGLPRPEVAQEPAAGLPVGAPAPDFALHGLYGETLTLESLRAPGKPVLLVFSDPGCGPCSALMPEIASWQRDEGQMTLALVSRGELGANRAKASEHGLTRVLLQQDREVAESYRCHGTPGAVLVNADGTIGSPLAMGAEQIRALATRPGARPASGPRVLPLRPVPAAQAPALKPAPSLALPDLTGKTVSLADFRGHPTMLLFWNPGCGFCGQMLAELQAWEASRQATDPQLVVISRGTVAENAALGLTSTVLLDGEFQAGTAFGAGGTPMAVLLDAEGRIASEVVAGGTAVMALARGDAASVAA